MEVWHMREHLAARYPGWEKKLRKMPDDQIIAIYMRMQRTKPVEKSTECIGAGYKAPERYIYECHRCYQWFESENPDIQECRYCGADRADMNVRPI